MQIKTSKGGRTIQVYRSVYVPEKKRSKQVLLLTFPAYSNQIPESALEKVKPERKLTENELKEVQTWLDARKADREESGLKYSVEDLPRSIKLSTEGIIKYGISNEQAKAIYKRIDEITKAIRKKGFTRPKSEPVKPPEPAQKKKTVSKKKAGKKKQVKKAGKKKNLKIKTSPGKGFKEDHNKLKKTGKKTTPKKTVKKAGKKVSKKIVKKTTGEKTGKPEGKKNAIESK